jgi:fumarate reductase subunit C
MFVAWGVVLLLQLVSAVDTGPESYAGFIAWLTTPWVQVLNILSFLFIVYHALTFFVAAPQALVMHVGGRRVPGNLIMLGHYGAWAVASLLIVWLLMGGRS